MGAVQASLRLLVLLSLCLHGHPLEVAVIGAGISGASFARYLHRHDPSVALTVYEKAERPGGRVRSISFTKTALSEAGASVYHTVNRNVRGFVEEFNLTTTQPYLGGRLALYSGQGHDGSGSLPAFLLETSRYSWITTAKMVWRYGLGLRTLNTLMERVVANFTALYDIIESGNPFEDVQEALQQVGLGSVSSQTLADALLAAGLPARLVDEFVAGTTRVNYGQAPRRMNAFAGFVALKGSGKDLYSVAGGNALLIERLLEHATASVRLQTRVTGISESAGRWQVHTADGATAEYDAVVICTPLTDASISLPESVTRRWPASTLGPPMWTTHATFIQGQLRPEYFGKAAPEELPNVVLTTENAAIPFSSIGRTPHNLCPLNEPAHPRCSTLPIYKVFSRAALSEEVVAALFRNVAFQEAIPWEAYPELSPRTTYPPVKLARGLYYPNSFEFAVSTMETQTIAARNAANLLAADFGVRRSGPAGLRGDSAPDGEL